MGATTHGGGHMRAWTRTLTAGLLGIVMIGTLAPGPAMAQAPTVAVASANKDFLDGLEELMPSLHEQYTDRQLVKLGRAICQALASGSTVKALDRATRKYLSEDETLALIALSAAAFCRDLYPKVDRFYGITAASGG